MKREIKFRAWTTHNGWGDGEMVTEFLESEETGYLNMNTRSVWYVTETHKIINGDLQEKLEWIEDKNIQIMQYTGLKDCNGVEIFEGDILKIKTLLDERIVKIELKQCLSGFIYNLVRKDGKEYWLPKFSQAFERPDNRCYVEVIGNIFENSDLL